MKTSRKNGSALLIVLGFLSFMVVSAVAFAIYMRAERLPSSALRRNVATRHLVKAALAEAISRVDDAVRCDPFPGLCSTNDQYHAQGGAYRDNNGMAMDVWQGRVFMPPDPQGRTVNRETRFAPATETVSVLNLEGLGYVPPYLANDVRFLSRGSWAAQWQQLPFDAGRFAFCAVNVSDFFDVNRVYAGRPRTAEPTGRLSVGYLFDSSFDPTAPVSSGSGNVVNFSSDATVFDNFVHNSRQGGDNKGDDVGRSVGNQVPYVSVLDYNLALGASGGSTSLLPVFYNWIAGSGSQSRYCEDGTANARSLFRQPFVTDSVPGTNETWLADISTAEGQPFYGLNLKNQLKVAQVLNHNSKFFKQAFSRGTGPLAPVDYVTLCDYLDHDDVPISLAMPCTERVPMVAALEQTVKFVPTVVPPKTDPPVTTADGKTTITYYDMDRNWFQPGVLSAVIAFPFKHGKTRNQNLSGGKFRAQALVRVFLAPEGISMRPGTFAESMRPKVEADWTKKEDALSFNGEQGVFMVSVASPEIDLTLPNSVEDEEDACCAAGGGNGIAAITINPQALNWPSDLHMITKKEVQPVDKNGTPSGAAKTTFMVNIRPLDGDGNPVCKLNEELDAAGLAAIDGLNLRPYVCVWVRIANDDGTVDLVPAYSRDDALNGGMAGDPVVDNYGGNSAPLMRFVGDMPFSFSSLVAGSFAGGTPTWSPKALYTVDPRFNWAPEDWYGVADTGVTFEKWLRATRAAVGMGTDETRDEDIFMFTSNQGVLQSLGEFAFLPRLCENGAELMGTSFDGAPRNSAADTLHFNCAWRSYVPSSEWYGEWTLRGVGRSVKQEFLVNPHTDNRAVMLGVLANTPVDYWAAARGMSEDCALRKTASNLVNTDDPWFKTTSEGLKHAFCSESEDGGDKLAYRDLVLFSEAIMNAMRVRTLALVDSKKGDRNWDPAAAWEEAWDDLPWDVRQNDRDVSKFLGTGQSLQNNVALHSVDRKFLYSYWRDCLGNRQQLFLIFVRAESNALGGPGEGTPAQQGGRAVALVWRNPSATRSQGRGFDAQSAYDGSGEREPHQTRILFYHQFE